MKPSTILTAALPALALASPTTKPRAPPQQPAGLANLIFGDCDDVHVPLDQIRDLQLCLKEHKTFNADFSKADDSVFSITDVEPTCCEQAKSIWDQLPKGRFGEAAFDEPCEGATVTGISAIQMKLLQAFFASIEH